MCAEEDRLLRERRHADAALSVERRIARRVRRREPLPRVVVPRATPAGETRITVAQASKRLSRSPQTIQTWIRQGRMQAERFGPSNGTYMIPESEIERLRPLLPDGGESSSEDAA